MKIPEPPHLSLYIPDNLVESVREEINYTNKEKSWQRSSPARKYHLKHDVKQWCEETLSGKWSLHDSKVFLGVSYEKQIPLNIQQWEMKFEKISDLIVFRLKWL